MESLGGEARVVGGAVGRIGIAGDGEVGGEVGDGGVDLVGGGGFEG